MTATSSASSSTSAAPTAGERHDLLVDVVERGLAIFGHPQGSDASHAELVEPDQLRLVAWELLVEKVKAAPVLPEQTSIEVG